MIPDIQRIDFHGHDLYSLRDEETGTEYVLPKRFCEIFELSWAGQHAKLTKNQLFKRGIKKLLIPSATGKQETIILELELLHAWLLSISPERVALHLQEKLLKYQRECAKALHDYWTKGHAVNPQATSIPLSPPSRKDELDLISQAKSLLEDLDQLTERDKLMLADQARNVMQAGQRLLPPPVTASEPPPALYGFSIAERVAQLGYRLSRKEQAVLYPKLGKRVAEEWRSRFGGQPIKETRWVDGAQRQVAWYAQEEASWLDPILQSYLSQCGIHTVYTNPEEV